ncbi:MAG: glycosyltransferase family 4 protein [Nitrospirae bacterium]|nr:MAG: glycosyltransferase family 4 protein [Nitrospirota bacterium]
MSVRVMHGAKAAGELLLLPLFLILVFGVCLPWLTVRRALGRRQSKPKIIWGPTPIINISTNAAADRLYGYQSDTLVYRPYFITADFTYNLERWWRYPPLALVIPWAVFLWAVLRYDIFHLYFDGGFLNRTLGKPLELPLLKLLGKKIIVSAYGGDVRVERITRTLGEYNCCMDCTQRLVACICDDNLARRNLAHVQRYADSTLSMGDMTEYTPGSRNDLFYWAIDLKKWPFVGVSLSSSPVKVLHAPNHPQFKGTRYLEACIKQLQDEGYPVQLVLVTGLGNEEAKEVYTQADIMADQFLIGWHGNFAVEAMALGKPVVAYIRKPEVYLPHGVECPIVNANPGTLRQALVTLIENPTLRYELGVKGRQYVEQVFSLERVGARMDRLYRQLEGDSAPVGGGVR